MIQIDWADTPGGYYALAYVLSCWVIIQNSPKKWKMGRNLFITAAFGVLLFTFMTVTHGITQWLFLPFMTVDIMIMWALVFLLCRYDRVTSFYFTVRAFIIGEFTASLEFQIFYYVILYKLLPLNQAVNIVLLLLLDSVILIIIGVLEKKNREVNANIQISGRELFSVIVIALSVYAVSNLSYIFESIHLADIIISQLYILRTLMDMGGVAILYAYHIQLGELNMRFEVQRLQDMLEMQHNNYEMLEQSVDVINQKYHDLKYQISILKSEAGSAAGMEYLDRMEQDIKAYEAQNKTGNKTLDTILTGKSLYCQQHWIELTSVADGEALNFIEPMDISILFGNMLDNAIESVSKIEHKEKRLIHLAVTKQKGFLRIRMENCYEKEPDFENGVPKTSKSDKRYHGFGIKSIQNIVKKYGGSTTIQAKDGWFEIRILIPLNRS